MKIYYWDSQLSIKDSGSAHLSDDLPHILDHHLFRRDGLHCEQTPVVDVTAAEADFLLAELQ